MLWRVKVRLPRREFRPACARSQSSILDLTSKTAGYGGTLAHAVAGSHFLPHADELILAREQRQGPHPLLRSMKSMGLGLRSGGGKFSCPYPPPDRALLIGI